MWPEYGYFQQQACSLSLDKAKMPEMTIFYLNQAYKSYKNNKKIYYYDFFIISQVIPLLNPPENLTNYEVKFNKAKVTVPKYNVVSGQFRGLVETLGHLTVHGDKSECFFDYAYSKDNRAIVYSTRKNKIPNNFSGTIFRNYKV